LLKDARVKRTQEEEAWGVGGKRKVEEVRIINIRQLSIWE
jgi:hypothetical protein